MIRLLKYFLFSLFIPIWWLQKLIPRNRDIWIFGAWYGHRYADNSRSLFRYVRKNHPKIKAIWLSRDKAVLKKIVEEGGKGYHTHSLKGIIYSLMAKNVFISSGKKDVNPLFIKGANWIQLWHGSPFKKIGLNDKYATTSTFFQRVIVKNCFPFASELNYDKIVSNASFFSPILASAFGVPLDCIIETGSPRNDVFYHKKQDGFNRDIRRKHPGCKIAYYLPTFRGNMGPSTLFDLTAYDNHKLESFLERQNLVLASKGHYIDNRIGLQNVASNRIIHLSDEDVSDINFMLKDADLLITDYSSIYFDFLLVEKPVIFAAFDLEEYTSGNRELPFGYSEVIAGPVVKSWAELYDALLYIWDSHNYEQQIREKNKKFNKYHDAHNSRRVYDAIAKLGT